MFQSSAALSGLGLLLLIVLPAVGVYPIGDLNEDSEVDFDDLRILADSWLNEICSVPGCEADLDGADGVNLVDLSILANNWGEKGTTLVINSYQ